MTTGLPKKQGMRFSRSVAITYFSQILLVVFGLIYSIITARYLGPVGKGILATLNVINATAVQFGNLGMHAAVTYFIGQERKLASKIASNALSFSLIIGTILVIVMYSLTHLGIFPDIPNIYFVFLLLIPFNLLSLFFRQILLIEGKIYPYNLVSVIAQIMVTLLSVMLLVFLHQGIFSIILLVMVAGALLALTNLTLVHRDIPFSWSLDFPLLKKMFGYAARNYVATLFAFLIIRSDLLLVNYFRGTGDAGIYSIAVSLINFLYLLPMTLGNLLFPKVSSQKTEEVGFTLKLSRHLTLIMALVVIGIGFIAKPLILLLYGEAYQGAIEPFMMLLPGLFFLSLVTIFNNDLAGRGMPHIVYIAPMVCFALNFSLNLWFIPRWGINGAAITSTISYCALFLIISVYFFNRFTASPVDGFLIKPQELADLKGRMLHG